jgi:phosphoglucosamine mutase
MTRESFVTPRFGTDGLRGHAGTPPLDPDTLRRVGAVLGGWIQRHAAGTERAALIGNDGRASAAWIRDALVQGLAHANVATIDLGLLTTPALAYLTRTQPCAAGIMISASHNPASDNGIKIFGPDGSKLEDAAEREIEAGTARVAVSERAPSGCASRPELLDAYREFLDGEFAGLDLEWATVVVDAANGGGSEIAPAVLRTFGARVVAVACAPDGHNINRGVGATHPSHIVPAVLETKATLGICLDGDGDRVIFVDEQGNVRDGDEALFALARQLDAAGALAGRTVVATVMSNLGLHRALRALGISVHVTPVGDRAVVQAMREHRFSLGGEQSGHIVFAHDEHFAGDGLFTALRLLSLLSPECERASALFAGFRRYPQMLLNVPVARKPDLATLPDVTEAVARVEAELGTDGRVVLRYSGTEDLCRVMVEGADAGDVQRHAEAIAAAVRRTLHA